VCGAPPCPAAALAVVAEPLSEPALVAHVAAMDTTAETQAWAPNPAVDGDWLEAVVVSRGEDGTVVLKTVANGDEHTCPADKLNLMNVLPEQGVEDMARLNYLHEPALLNNLRHRFALDHVYTYTAKICIAVNPFDWQVSKPLYGEEVLCKYRGREMSELPPHVYAIAEDAYQKILDAEARNGNNQSVLVSGESGAGKTEAVKIMMNYLAAVSRAGETNLIAQQVLASNPLLEAFGNAKTSRNNNSSRFGKFIEIQFDQVRSRSSSDQVRVVVAVRPGAAVKSGRGGSGRGGSGRHRV